MKRLIFCASALTAMLAMLSACNDDNELQDISKSDAAATTLQLTPEEISVLKTMDGQSPIISQDEAISIAGNFLGKTSLSKSAPGIKCEVITRQSPSISKSGSADTDTLMYVLNYGDGDGYALVCADIRVPEQILAFSETGSLDDNSDNPGLEIFMNLAQSYMDTNIAEIERKRDSLEESINNKINQAIGMQNNSLSKRKLVYSQTFECTRSSESYIIHKHGPLLHTHWGQYAPFNNYVPTYTDSKGITKHCPAGCVPIATSQLMAYWKWPNYIQGINMQWETLNFDDFDSEKYDMQNDPSYRNRVATLVSYVGQSINTNYQESGSGAWQSDAINFLSQNGYITYGETDYNSGDIIQSIQNDRPLLITGYHYPNTSGHCWLLDGHVEQETATKTLYMIVTGYQEDNGTTTTYQVPETKVTYTQSDYFHCNWGWKTSYDGYFLDRIFDTKYRYEVSASGTRMTANFFNDDNGYYQYRLKIAKNIHR